MTASRRELGLSAAALFLGLWGNGWGLPDRARVEAVLPPGLDSPEFRALLGSTWREMHRQKGPNLMISPTGFATFQGVQRVPPGWKTPPELLLNSARSFYLRSAYEDEQTLLLALSRMRPRRLELHPHMFVYGGAYLYPLGAWLAANSLVGLAYLSHSVEDYLARPERMASLYRCGRLLSVLAYLACVLLIHRTGVRFFDKNGGFLAAAIFALSPGVVFQAHIMKMHTYWPLFSLLAFYFSCGVLERGERGLYRRAGAAAGLAVGSFLNAWPSCVIVASACAIRILHAKAPPRRELRGLVESALACLGAFLLFNPYYLLDPREALQEVASLRAWSALDPRHAIAFALNPVRGSLTAPFLAAALVGCVLAIDGARRQPARLLCAVSFLFALAATSTVGDAVGLSQVRYFIGWLGLAGLLAASAVTELAPAGARARRLYGAVVLALVLNLGALGATYSYNCRLAATGRSTWAESGRWLEANVAPGRSLGLLRLPQPSNSPYFRWDRYDLRFIEPRLFDGLKPAELPEYLCLCRPDYDDRPRIAGNLARYELVKSFERGRLLPWVQVPETAMSANPSIEIYRIKGRRA